MNRLGNSPKEFWYKLKAKAYRVLVINRFGKKYYNYLYRSYWHFIFHKKTFVSDHSDCFFTAKPNPGAGIGHQISNWNAGYWYSKVFKVRFAHIPFSHLKDPFMADEWDAFLGLGEGEPLVKRLIGEGYKVIKLPMFEETERGIELISSIIASYKNGKYIFCLEQDQLYSEQCGVMDYIQDKFYHSSHRYKDKLIYSKDNYNLAIHIRRGDIVQNIGVNNPGLSKRWLDDEYFYNVLKNALKLINTQKEIHIYLFSQGTLNEFDMFNRFPNVHYCLDMEAMESFLHMVYADALIISKSSFSYKPALLNQGLKICPMQFWHSYPNSSNWLLADEKGNIIS